LCCAGPHALVARGIGREVDLERTESEGCLLRANPAVSARAHERSAGQLGTAGAGKHFAEFECFDHVFDPVTAEAFGLVVGN
jgi:tRNA-splicing ligase RtcB (3'-phosphate/5'-hydroxy nucleic acid ligase)